MRLTSLVVSLFVWTSCLSAVPVFAASLTQQDAVSRVQSAGYPLVSKAEPAPGSWDVWASKDGIAYEVKINAEDGSLIAAVPLEDND